MDQGVVDVVVVVAVGFGFVDVCVVMAHLYGTVRVDRSLGARSHAKQEITY